LKVLHISTYDIRGGAARAAYRLHQGLVRHGIDSGMLVQKKFSDGADIETPYFSDLGKFYAKARPYANSLIQKFQKTDNHSPHSANFLPSGLHRLINRSDVDLIHLHWINKEMISVSEIAEIKKPIIWTLHDMWAFCGAEHVVSMNNPMRYKQGYLSANRPINNRGLDIDRWTWNRKIKYWKNIQLQLVSPGTWLKECIEESVLFGDYNVSLIHNGLDLDLFKPVTKKEARRVLNLPQGKKIITFGAMDPENDPNKGYSYLKEAIKLYAESGIDKENLYFCVFGHAPDKEKKIAGIDTYYFGEIADDTFLSLIYSAADVIVVPSLIESFGQTASEALACGTPVVAFNTSGLKDIVNHKNNGFLAEPFKPESLTDGIIWILSSDERINTLSNNARDTALKKFDIKKISKKYVDLYADVLNRM
jgi:glycosyltransferase involved in cell wall biosynthesis